MSKDQSSCAQPKQWGQLHGQILPQPVPHFPQVFGCEMGRAECKPEQFWNQPPVLLLHPPADPHHVARGVRPAVGAAVPFEPGRQRQCCRHRMQNPLCLQTHAHLSAWTARRRQSTRCARQLGTLMCMASSEPDAEGGPLKPSGKVRQTPVGRGPAVH